MTCTCYLQKTSVEFFGVPLNDRILHEASVMDILAACKGVLEEINRWDIYEDHYDLYSRSTSRDVLTGFFIALAKIPPKDQQLCFDKIVDKLKEDGGGKEHILKRLRNGKRY